MKASMFRFISVFLFSTVFLAGCASRGVGVPKHL
jgi:hypothetical protein